MLPIVFVAAAIFYEKSRQKKINSAYDEMQLRIRGKGAWYGFYGAIIYLAACSILENAFSVHFLSAFHAVFLGVMISGSIIAGYSILHDSYYGMNRTHSWNLAFILLISAADAFCVFYLIRMFMEGVFQDLNSICTDERLIAALCIPLLTTILVTTLIRHLKPEEEDE